jgi:ribosomal protein S18 acetylase RimI-like enzyme
MAMHARSLEVQRLAATDLVAMAQCMAIDAEVFPYASIPFGLPAGLRTWVARGEDADRVSRVIGFLAGTFRSTSFYIQGLAVGVAARRSGVGRALLHAAVAEARARGIGSVYLHVGVTNRPAVLLYDSEGFEVRGTVRDFYRPGVYPVRDAYEMVLRVRRSA